MNNRIVIVRNLCIALLAMTFASASLYSQDRPMQNIAMEMSERFELEIGALRDSVACLREENDRLHKELSKASKVVEGERDERKRLTKETQKLVDELKEANGRMSEKLKPYDDKIKSQRRELAIRDSLIVVYKDSVSYFHSVILRNETLLADLSGVRNQRVKELLVAENSYMSVPYSQVDTSHISDVVATCEMLKDPRTDSLKTEFRQLLQKKNIYDSLMRALEEPYDSLSVSERLSTAEAIYNNSSEAQKTEIDSVRTLVLKYKVCNEKYPTEIIKFIADFMRDYRTDDTDFETAYSGARYVLNMKRIKSRYNDYIAPIPYLVRRFDEYKSALLAHPKEKPELEKELNID